MPPLPDCRTVVPRYIWAPDNVNNMAESDGSSEMSDDALHKLVSRLVEAGKDLEDDDLNTACAVQNNALDGTNARRSVEDTAPGGSAADSLSDAELLDAAAGEPIWPSSAPDNPSPIQAPRHSPRADGMDQEAALLSSAEASDASSSGRQGEDLLAVGASTAGFVEADAAAETDSCGYEGDVGESARIIPSVRRLASVVVVAPPGMPTKDGGEEADDEGSGRAAAKSHHPQGKSLDMALRASAYFARSSSMGKMSSAAGQISWEDLNETLRDEGFPQVPLSRPGGAMVVPDLARLAETLRDVVSQHGDRGKIIQELSLELSKHNRVAEHRDHLLNDSFRREKSDLFRRSAGAEARVAALEEETSRLQERLANETRRLKIENANLALQLKQSEHRVKAQEAASQGLKDKLRDEARRERMSQQRERELLTKFRQDKLRAGGANDSRVTNSLIAYSKVQERTEEEMDLLRAEVSRLGDELREKENRIVGGRLGSASSPGADERAKEMKEMRDRLAESVRSVRVLRQREARVLERCADVEKEHAIIQAKLDETQDALANAQLEVSSRPSIRTWRASQKKIQILEKKLAQATTQAKEALDVAELRRWVDTRELMRRDRGNHRLQLDRMDELPATVLKQVLQDVCRLLALQDVSLLGPSVAKLTKAVQMLPRLERFVNGNSAEALQVPRDASPEFLHGRTRTMEDVLPLLRLWLARIQEPVHLREFRRGVLQTLELRADRLQGTGRLSGNSHAAALLSIQHLVDLERRTVEEAMLNRQADRSLNDDPELPVSRVVRHFQLLFGVKSIHGCIARLNEVYRFSSEANTFFRTAGDSLDMPDATPEAIMKRVESFLAARPNVNPDNVLLASHDADSWAAAQAVKHHVEA